ncbi:DUF3238 domain-containing protein [Pseudobacillus badius]|uniref:DUF3238 domain-containing protein n=1 Tax=Bacillus badius TaxID=1455 RepID=UPI0007BC2965|nr:DUF3238 domain-containing protein [Bacillus badius]KZR56802.1 hypothetical protein A3781_05960 [Bacillus badius]
MLYRYPIAAACLAGAAWLSLKRRRQQRLARINSLMIKSIEQKENEITFHWKGKEETYNVYREGELIYSGSDSSATDTGLIAGKTYLYTVEALDANKRVMERIKVQTATATKDKSAVNILQDLIVTTVVTESLISMEWEPIDGVEEYTVYRNGERLAKVREGRFIDYSVRADQAYTYSIHAVRPLLLSEKGMSEEKFAAAGIIGFFKKGATEKEAAFERFRLTKQIGSLRSVLKPEPPPSAETEWTIRYMTFLEDKWLKNPNFFSPLRYFKGDGRGFDADSVSYRTKADILINYDEEIPTIRLVKDVGQTKAYGWLRRFKKEDTASEEGIKLEKENVTKEKLFLQLAHSVGNPLVTSPAIDYKVKILLCKSGFFDISGIHDQSPHHEVYMKNSSQASWQPIHQAESKGLEWLSETMADQFWRLSNFK